MITLDSAGTTMGTLALFAPPRHLAGVIEHTWIESRLEGASPRLATPPDRVVPDGGAHLLVHLPRTPGATARARLVGARSVGVTLDKSRRAATVGLRLRPGRLDSLFGVAGSELLDRSEGLDALLEAGDRSRLATTLAGSDREAIRQELLGLIERLARRPAAGDWRVDAATRLIALRQGRISVDELCRHIGVPPRTLRRALSGAIGFGPKRLARIERLYGLIRQGLSDPGLDGARLSAAAGFSDQAHMIRETRALLGETPARFLRRGARRRSRSGRFVQGWRPAIG